MISRRALSVDASGIRKVFELASQLKDPINFSIGQPDFDVPEEARERAVEAIRKGKNKYTVTQGIPELREEIGDNLRHKNIPFEDVFVTSGVSGGILLSLLAVTDPGDEIVITDPYFVMYRHLANLLGLNIRFIDTYPDFKLTAERLERVLSEKTKMVFINSPSNPTGSVLSSTELKDIASVLERFSPLAVYDEIYSEFDYEKKHGCLSCHYERTLLLNGFSKSHAMTGWRIGYASGPKDIIEQMIKLQQYTFVCSPSMVQYGCLNAVSAFSEEIFRDYRKKRDLAYGLLSEKFQIARPEGAFYIFPEAPGGDGESFVKRAVENNVLIIPGNVFSAKNTHFRLSFATSMEAIEKGCGILNSLG